MDLDRLMVAARIIAAASLPRLERDIRRATETTTSIGFDRYSCDVGSHGSPSFCSLEQGGRKHFSDA